MVKTPIYRLHLTLPSSLYCTVTITATVHTVQCTEQQDLIMKQLTEHFESDFIEPWSLNSVTQKNKDIMYQQLSFIELDPIAWHGHFKLSQNKSIKIRRVIKDSLMKVGKNKLADMFITE